MRCINKQLFLDEIKASKENIENAKSTYVVFDKKCNFKFLKTIKDDSNHDFPDFYTFEKWLKRNKLYGHFLWDFIGKSDNFYEKTFEEKLTSLGWIIKKGKIKGIKESYYGIF